MKCLRLTTNAFLVGFGTQHAGLLLNQGEDYLYLTLKKRVPYKTLALFEKQYGKLEYNEVEGGTNAVSEINGYPVKHSDAVLLSTDPALYSRSGHGSFSAGYWVINRDSGRALVFCPKTATLEKVENHGPFKTRLETFSKIASMKHAPRDTNAD